MADPRDYWMGSLAAQDGYRGDWPQRTIGFSPPSGSNAALGSLAASEPVQSESRMEEGGYRGGDQLYGPPDNPWARGVQRAADIEAAPRPRLGPAPGWGGNAREIGGRMGDIGNAALETFRAPAQLAAKNPYPPGTEEWQQIENWKGDLSANWAGDWALNLLAPARLGGGVKGPALGVGGGKIVQPQPKMGDLAAPPGSQAWRDAPNPNAPFPQYATEYSPVGPPQLMKDKATGKEYWSKVPTPEAEAFMAARTKIMKDMEKNGYTPYFDPEKRFDVDPTNYPLNVDTTQIVPKKPDLIAKHLEKIGADETRKRLQDAYAKGVELGGTGPRLTTQDWYQMGQLEAELVQKMGPEAGRAGFREKFATPMAATTGGMDPRSNLIAAGYHNYQASRGLPWEMAANQWPSPVGARYGAQLAKTAQNIAEGGGFQALGEANPKRHNFAGNFMGHRTPGTMDEQMTMLMQNKGVPDWYGINERIAAEEAAKIGVDPRKFQETGWHGFKGISGTPMISEVNAAVERTHRLTGMPRSEIVRRAWGLGDIPIYAVPGVLGMGALADQSRRRLEE